jgi:hypothetical protein
MYQVILAGGTAVAGRLAPYAASAAARFGIPSTAAALLNYARSNPVMFSLASKEITDNGVTLYDWLVGNDPEAADSVQKNINVARRMLGAIDPVDTIDAAFLAKVDSLTDELDTIQVVVNALGGYDRLQALRRVLQMNDTHFAYFAKDRLGV